MIELKKFNDQLKMAGLDTIPFLYLFICLFSQLFFIKAFYLFFNPTGGSIGRP